YRIYWGVKSGEWQKYIAVGRVATAAITGLLPGATYYFCITAVNTAGLESEKSNIVHKTIVN
ncbi:MAG: fibronectin type III domain-containing protein, partial [Cetobacterium sp.]